MHFGPMCILGQHHTMEDCLVFSVSFKYFTSDQTLYFIMVFTYILSFQQSNYSVSRGKILYNFFMFSVLVAVGKELKVCY